MDELEEKRNRLQELIRERSKNRSGVMVAFSGGVDSSLLLLEAVQAIGPGRVMAVSAIGPTSPPGEPEEAAHFCKVLGAQHLTMDAPEFKSPDYLANPRNRCYLCKCARLDALKDVADSHDLLLVDGAQADDKPEERPGMAALEERGVLAPLAEAGLGKTEIRRLLRRHNHVELSEKSAQPCLATRIPFNSPITEKALTMIAKGEAALREMGFQTIRLRHHFPIARIVTDKAGLRRILLEEDLRERIETGLRQVGYQIVTLDLKEYGK
jgi:uncharacterized protein